MSTSSSFLSAPRYGYGFVVATTQASINAALKQYLSGLDAPLTTHCWTSIDGVNYVPVTLDEVVAGTKTEQTPNGVNPFEVPPNTSLTDPRILALWNYNFVAGWQAQLGLPPGYAAANIPNVVALAQNSQVVDFTLMCSVFTVVSLAGRRDPGSWVNESQPPGNAWLFTSQINLTSLTVGSSDYNKLPLAVQKAINNLGLGAFSVQQLLFDLDNAALETMPTISGVDSASDLYTLLTKWFLNKYFNQMKDNGQPVLGYTVSQHQGQEGTLALTALSRETSPFVDSTGNQVLDPDPEQQRCLPLCYLCATDANAQPPTPVPFNWNWIETNEESQFDGAMAINRNVFANYIAGQIAPQLPPYCWTPWVHVHNVFGGTEYDWSMTSGNVATPQLQSNGSNVYKFSWSPSEASDTAGLDLGKMAISTSLDVTVTFQGNQIIISQHLIVYVYIRVITTADGGNVVDKTITDTYTLGVGQDGALTAHRSSDIQDNSKKLGVNGFLNFFTDFNKLASDIESWLNTLVGTNFTDLPLSVAQNFVFSGGSTFTFADVNFSNNEDLVSHINYLDPQ